MNNTISKQSALDLYYQLKEQLALEQGNSNLNLNLLSMIADDIGEGNLVLLLTQSDIDIDINQLTEMIRDRLPDPDYDIIIKKEDLRYNLYRKLLCKTYKELNRIDKRVSKVYKLINHQANSNQNVNIILHDLIAFAYYGNSQAIDKLFSYCLDFLDKEGKEITVEELLKQITGVAKKIDPISVKRTKKRIIRDLINTYYEIIIKE